MIKPLADKVLLVEVAVQDKFAKLGIIIPNKKEKMVSVCDIIDIGPDVSLVEKAQKVLVIKPDFEEIEFEDKKYLIGSENLILAWVEDENIK